ncbi:MAG: hypothetical protein ACOC53_06920 [Candidatus Saliniplasma sp.]
MDMSKILSVPNENPNLPPKLKEAREMMRYASIFFLVAALLYGLWGLWSIMQGIFWSTNYYGTYYGTGRIIWGVIYLVFAGVAVVLKGKFEDDILNPIDNGQSGAAKDKCVIYIILGLIFGMVLSGLLILLGYMKLGEVDTQASICPDCRGAMRYVQEYQKWYCDNCQDYKVPIHPASATQPPQQQQGWGQTPPPPPDQQQQQGWQQSQQQQPPQQQQGWQQSQQQEQNICPTCGNQARYIQEYDRYYCDNCGKYL